MLCRGMRSTALTYLLSDDLMVRAHRSVPGTRTPWQLGENCCVKRVEQRARRGFDSPRVHHKQLLRLGRIGIDLITLYRLRLLMMGPK